METKDLLASVTAEQRIDLLRKNWMSHDARWQMVVFREWGWDKGNQLNQEVAREMGKVMMYRLMNVLSLSQVKGLEELQAVCSAAMELYYPLPVFAYHFKRLSDTSLLGVIEKCSIYENIKKAEVSDYYECGCFAMRSGWYEALGIEVEETLGKCLKSGDERCEIFLQIKSENP